MTTSSAAVAHRITILGLLRMQWGAAVVAFFLLALASLLGLAQPLVAGRIVESVGDQESVIALTLLLIALVTAQVGADAVGHYVQELMGERGALRAREAMAEAILLASLKQLAGNKSGDVVTRFTTDGEAIRDGVSRGYIQLATALVSAVGAGVFLASIDWLLLVVVFLILIVAGLGALMFLSRIETASEAKQQALGRVGLNAARIFQGIRTVRLFGAHAYERHRLRDASMDAFGAGRRFAKWTAAVTPAIELAATGSFLALLIVGGSRVASGQLDLAGLISALLYSTILVVPLGGLLEAGISLSTAAGALRRINELLGMESEDRPNAGVHTDEGIRTHPPTCALEVSDLHFAFDSSGPAIAGLSFRLPIGASLLLRGSGSGKTTLVNLVCKFYESYAGSIRLFGREVSQLTASEARGLVALVEQDSPVLFGTVRENLAYGNSGRSEEVLLSALDEVGLLARLGGRSCALDREIAEQGAGLSGGERQRLALARALISDRPLIILDEPTSSLDEGSRKLVVEALSRRRSDQSLLIISHDDDDQAWTDMSLSIETVEELLPDEFGTS